ncbi:MAG: pentapeptide repeat-containing protein [Saprospiraceae bacterium]|nr:pentapeptide repeat-containing protein [Saprospiraceae bacterium]
MRTTKALSGNKALKGRNMSALGDARWDTAGNARWDMAGNARSIITNNFHQQFFNNQSTMKSNNLIQLASILFFLAFLGLQQAAAQDCSKMPYPQKTACYAALVKMGIRELPNADLRGENLRGLDFGNAILTQANLSKGVFRGTDFPHTDFSGADLSGADFRGTDMKFANLVGANLTGTLFDGADLMNAKVSRKTTKGIADFDAFADKYFVRIED